MLMTVGEKNINNRLNVIYGLWNADHQGHNPQFWVLTGANVSYTIIYCPICNVSMIISDKNKGFNSHAAHQLQDH